MVSSEQDYPVSGSVEIHVSSMAELKSALQSADGETEIVLSGGNYGILDLYAPRDTFIKFDHEVVIRSANPDDPAVFTGVVLTGASNLTFDGVVFDYNAAPGDAEYFKPFQVLQSSAITIRNAIFDGDDASSGAGAGYGTGFGLYVDKSQDITVENSEFYAWMRGALFSATSDLRVEGNDVHDVRSDGLDFVDVDNVLIAGNYIHDFRRQLDSTDHPDMIQFWTAGATSPSTNIVIRGNFLDSGEGGWTQSIFMRNEAVDSQGAGVGMYYQNVTIEDNVIYNSHLHGITVGEATGLVISNNTLLQNAASNVTGAVGLPTINIAAQSRDVHVTENILTAPINGAGAQAVISGNLVVQRTDPDGPGYYGDLFVNALADGGAGLADLAAVPGGLVSQLGVGSSLTVFGVPAGSLGGFLLAARGDGLAMMQHHFDASNLFLGAAAADLDGATVVWDFGDGTLGSGVEADHAYTHAGAYRVIATVTLGDGRSAIIDKTIDVQTPVALAMSFNDGAGDESDVPNPVTVPPGVTFVDNGGGSAVKLNGSAIKYDRSPELLGNDAYTMLFDFRKEAGAEDASGWAIYFTGSFNISVEADGVVAALTTSAGNITLKALGLAINDADWHQAAVAFSGQAGTAILYVDGREVARAEGLEGAVQVGSPSHDFYVGDPYKPGFSGLIDNVAFLRGAISAEDAASLAAAAGAGRGPALDLLWPAASPPDTGHLPDDPPTVPDPGDPLPSNGAPTGIRLSSATVAEDAANGTVVGTLSAIDPDTDDSFTFVLRDDAGGRFALDGARLILVGPVDYETANAHAIAVEVRDSAGNTLEKELSVAVVNRAPQDVRDADGAGNAVTDGAARGTAVGITARSSDVNGGTVRYTLADDAGGRFRIDATTGVVTVADGMLLDSRKAGKHTIQIQATDPAGASTTRAFDITVASVPAVVPAPAFTVLDGDSAADTVAAGAAAGTYVGIDAEVKGATGSVTFSLADDAGGRFAIDARSGVVTVARPGLIDDDLWKSHKVTVVANSADGSRTSTDFNVDVTPIVGAQVRGTPGRDKIGPKSLKELAGTSADALVIDGRGGADVLRGGRAGDKIVGGSGADKIVGKAGSDKLYGGAGKDKLKGGPGDDLLDGGPGKDKLAGGAGADAFFFRDATSGRDQIKDFISGTDTVILARSGFDELSPGELDPHAFQLGKHATGSDAVILYHQKSGNLAYDPDGAGGAHPLAFARLRPGTDLDASDILVG